MIRKPVTHRPPQKPPQKPQPPALSGRGIDTPVKPTTTITGRTPTQPVIQQIPIQPKPTITKPSISKPSMGPATSTSGGRIAFLAFNRHIATEITNRLAGEYKPITGSPEQEAIWHEAVHGTRHIVVNAMAGSGKTTTGLEICKRLGGMVDAMTYHSLGFRILKQAFGRVEVDQYKVYNIIDDMRVVEGLERKEQRVVKSRIAQLVGLAKQYMKYTPYDLKGIMTAHDIDAAGREELIIEAVPNVLQKCRAMTSVVDFDDQVWLPVELGLGSRTRYDVVITDEAQDLNMTQQKLALSAGDRHIVVGDSRQAIYLFRGADSQSMGRMRERLAATDRGVVDLPLTVTRRCPKLMTAMAQQLVPEIKALDNAPMGSVRIVKVQEAIQGMKPGDMVLCRVNAPLLITAYKLLRAGTRAVVRGRDIGQGIVQLIEAAEKKSGQLGMGMLVSELLDEAGTLTFERVVKFQSMPNGRGEMRAAAEQDKYECLVALSEGCGMSGEVKSKIEQLFVDADVTTNAVLLSTIHRGKGLEAGRVWVLEPQLIPHPMAKKDEDQEVERNAAYIAVTRVKFTKEFAGELVWVDDKGQGCGLFRSVGDAPLSQTEDEPLEDEPLHWTEHQ